MTSKVWYRGRIYGFIEALGFKYGENGKSALLFLKRFLDDLFKITQGTTKNLHKSFDEINQIHPSLKFTMTHTSPSCETYEDKCQGEPLSSVPYLDTLCSIEKGKIEIDLYKKKTDRNQYLLPNNCHVKTVTKNIPYSLALRIVRICTKPVQKDLCLKELRELLLERSYSTKLIDCSISRARDIPRQIAFKKVIIKSKDSQGPIFALQFDPRLPSIQNLQAKHWRSMTSQNQYLKSVFPRPPLTAFRRQANIRNLLVRAKVAGPPRLYQSRSLKGMVKCGKGCTACPFLETAKNIKIDKKTLGTLTRKCHVTVTMWST